MHLVSRMDLFKISNLVLGGKEIVTSLCSNLKRERKRTSRTCAGVYMSCDMGNSVT